MPTRTTQTPEQRAAWGHIAVHEPRWQARIAIAVALALYVTLPDRYTIGPIWLIAGGEAILLVILTVGSTRHQLEDRVARIIALALIGVINLANVVSLALLVHSVIAGQADDGRELIVSSVEIWLTNVIVFGLWYWEIDRGGPIRRCREDHLEPDFLFPQMATPFCAPERWTPNFLDYLYVSFTNATAFSPTDTMPLTNQAKSLMTVESIASLITVAVVAARAVNILK